MKKFTESFYLNAMDPGGTTGMSLLRIDRDDYAVMEQAAVPYRPETGETPTAVLKAWRHRYDDLPHVFVYEDFHVRPIAAVPDTTALSVIAEVMAFALQGNANTHITRVRVLLDALRFVIPQSAQHLLHEALAALEQIPSDDTEPAKPVYLHIAKQEPVQAKQLVKDLILDRLGLKASGPYRMHIDDANRHAATWLALLRYMPICVRGWPPKQPAPRPVSSEG